MNTKKIVLLIIPINIILFYFVFNSVNSQIKFEKSAKLRIEENIQKLKDLRQVQIAYKKVKNNYADNFKDLIDFLENDSMPIIKSIGETPDTLTDEEALKLKIISRDTAYISAKESVFDKGYITTRDKRFLLNTDSLTKIPYCTLEYNINAGTVEKGKVTVHVFEISTSFQNVFANLNAKNKGYELNNLLKVGSMNEASLNGNWGE